MSLAGSEVRSRGLLILLFLVACGDGDARGTGPSGSGGFGGSSAGIGGVGGTGSGGVGGVSSSDAGDLLDAGGLDATIADAQFVDADVDGSLADAGIVEPAFVALFDPEHLPTFEITLPQSSIDALTADGLTYQPATLRYGDIVLENVGVRLKGRASYQSLDQKPGLKIKLNEFVPGQKLLGLKRLTLNNMTQDPTMARERLAYLVFREMGVPAPLCNHARVYINGEYYGLYANVQTLDEEFVESRWNPAPGNLYDITNAEYHIDFEREHPSILDWNPPPQETKFELETNKTLNDTSDLTALIDAVSESSNANFLSEVEALMDLDEVLAMGAVQGVIADWDGYFGARNNYKAYHELSQDRFLLFPWGVDQTFGIQDDSYDQVYYSIDHSNSGRPRSLLYDRCERNVSCRSRYFDQVQLALALFERLDLETELDDILMQVTPSIMEDTHTQYSLADHTTGVANLRDFLQTRAEIVRMQLP